MTESLLALDQPLGDPNVFLHLLDADDPRSPMVQPSQEHRPAAAEWIEQNSSGWESAAKTGPAPAMPASEKSSVSRCDS